MKTKPKTQCQIVLADLKRNKKGITSLEAAVRLGIVCLHKRIAEIDGLPEQWITHRKPTSSDNAKWIKIERTPERTATGSTVTRYKLAR